MSRISRNRKMRSTRKQCRSRSCNRRMYGGCGCSSNNTMRGGDFLDDVPKSGYYPINNVTDLSGTNMNSRISGGGRRTNRRHPRRSKRGEMHGGNYVPHTGVNSYDTHSSHLV